MEGDRTAAALARIEAAMNRIEKVEPALAQQGFAAERKYRDLRAQAASALAELDTLIGSLEK